MATPLENYNTAYQNVSDQIATYSALIATSGNDVLSYSIEGQTESRKDIFAKLSALYEQQKTLLQLIQIEGGPYEVQSFGVPI